MKYPFRAACVAVSSLLAACLACAESLLPPERVPLDSLAAFRPTRGNWMVAGGLAGDPRHDPTLTAAPGTGVLVNNPRKGAPNDALITTWEHGDIDVDLDFLIPPGANSGVYLQGRYEVQIFDSAGVKVPLFSDCGGIYQRWDESRGPGRSGYGGHAPSANASRAPGLWQHLRIEFRAARFDAQGRKVAHARFATVALNGYVVQEDVEVTGPTRGSPFADEKPTGPLLIQGDHGSIAVRNLTFKRYGAAMPQLQEARVKYYAGKELTLADYASHPPAREAALEHLPDAVQRSDERGIAVVTGRFVAPNAGTFEFSTDIFGAVRVTVDGHPVVTPGFFGQQAGTVVLAAGTHDLKFEYLHANPWALGDRGLRLQVEGPGITRQWLLPAKTRPPAREISIPIEPESGRVRLQRTFVALDHSRRMYACFVGSPAGVHYAYDLERAAIIGVWRGGFFEGRDLWHERAEDQQAHPTGPGFLIEGRPLLFQFGDHDQFWPTQPPQPSESRGYRLEADGQPVFRYFFSGITVEDRIAALPDGSGLNRKLVFGGKSYGRPTFALLAEDSTITPQPGGGGYIIGDREYYLDWPKDAPDQPVLRREGDRVQLLVRVPDPDADEETEIGDRTCTYNLLW
jgi:hypothetical protein